MAPCQHETWQQNNKKNTKIKNKCVGGGGGGVAQVC